MMQDVLALLIREIQGGTVKVIDLTQPLNSDTPVIELPEGWGQTPGFSLKEISRYDERGPF